MLEITGIAPTSRKRAMILVLSLVVITCAVFLPTLDNGFTNYDDPLMLTENPVVKEFSWENIGKVFSIPYAVSIRQYLPLVSLSFMVEYRLAGLDSRVYHITNLVLHVLTVLLVFRLVWLLSRRWWMSFWVALVFSIHPVHVQSVAWITERKDVLYGLFFVAALIAYFHFRKENKFHYYAFTMVFFVLSLMAKSMAVVLPFLLIAIDYFLDSGTLKAAIKKWWLDKVPFFVISFFFLLINMVIAAQAQLNILDYQPLGLWGKSKALVHGIVFSFQKLAVPYPLSAYYPRFHDSGYLMSLPFLITALALVLFLAVYLVKFRKNRQVTFGVWFFFLSFLPVLMLFFMDYPPFDHYWYLPCLGIIYALAQMLAPWLDGLKSKGKKTVPVLGVFLGVLIAGMSVLSWQRCFVWKDSMTLWNDAITHYPTHVAFNNRGLMFIREGKIRRAAEDFNKALAIKPHFETYYNRGLAYEIMGDRSRALRDYDQSIRLNSGYAPAYNNRGLVFAGAGDYTRALENYSKALEIRPEYPKALNNRSLALQALGKWTPALKDLNRAIALDPGRVETFYNRAMLFLRAGRPPAALADLNRVITLNPGYAPAYYNRGIILQMSGKEEEAVNDFEAVNRLDPRFLQVYPRLVRYYRKTSDTVRVEQVLNRFEQHRPDIIMWLLEPILHTF